MCQFSDKAICFQSSPIKWIVALNLHAQKYLHTHTNLNCICSMILILHNRNIHTLRVLINVEVLNKVLGNHLQQYGEIPTLFSWLHICYNTHEHTNSC